MPLPAAEAVYKSGNSNQARLASTVFRAVRKPPWRQRRRTADCPDREHRSFQRSAAQRCAAAVVRSRSRMKNNNQDCGRCSTAAADAESKGAGIELSAEECSRDNV